MKKTKTTQTQCIYPGGHCWSRRAANYSTRYPDGSPRFRVCKHCGYKDDLTKLVGGGMKNDGIMQSLWKKIY